MAEHTPIPNSAACGQWETLLPEALDGQLKADDEAFFSAHVATCPACTALLEDARKGREWLEFLSPEPEIPTGLFARILAQTGPGQAGGFGIVPGSAAVLPAPLLWQRPSLIERAAMQLRRFAEPRLLMTAAMAFFTVALTINLTGVRLNSLRLADLRPNAVRSFMERRLTMASTPVVRYYDHLRFVYEVESTVRELRRTQIESNSQGGEEQQKQKDIAPGESRQNPGSNDGGTHAEPAQQSEGPSAGGSGSFLESSLNLQAQPAHSAGSAMEVEKRSTAWTA
jgi:Putative zinc-finger